MTSFGAPAIIGSLSESVESSRRECLEVQLLRCTFDLNPTKDAVVTTSKEEGWWGESDRMQLMGKELPRSGGIIKLYGVAIASSCFMGSLSPLRI